MSTSSVRAGEAFIELTTKDTKLVKGLLAAQARLKAFGTAVNDIGMKLVGITGMISIPLAFITKNFADFDDQMRVVAAKTGATKEELEQLTETAKKLGRETSFSASQVASGMAAMAASGFKTGEIMKSIGDFMNLDRATSMNNLSESIRYAGSAMNSFGLSASDASRIADVLTITANASAQNLTDLGEAIIAVGPSAKMSNATLEDTCAMLGVLANMGIKGTTAGTALAKTFQRLAAGKGLDVLKGKGIGTTDSQGNLRNMRDILIDISKVTKTMGSAEKLAFLTEVFDVRGLKGGGALSGELKNIDEMMSKIANSGGVAAETARQMDSGIGGSFRSFMSAVEGVGLEIGNIIGDYIRPYLAAITNSLRTIAEWVKMHKEVVITLIKAGAAIGAAGVAMVAFGTTVKLLAFSCGGLAIALRGVTAALLLPVRAFTLLASAIGMVKAVITGISGLILAVKTASIAAAVAVKAFAMSGIFVKSAMVILAGAVGVAKVAVLAAMGVMAAATVIVQGLMIGVTGLKVVVMAIPAAFVAVKTAIAGTVAVLTAAKAAFVGLHLAVNAPIVAVALLHIAMVKIRAVFLAVSAVVATVKTAIAGFNIVTAASSGIAAAWTAAMGIAKTVITGFAAAFGAIKSAVTGFNIVQAVSIGLQTAWNAVVTAGHAVMAALTGAFATVKTAVVGFNIAAAASRALMLAWNGIVIAGKAIWTAFVAVFGAAKTAVVGFNVVQAVGTALQTAYNAVIHAGTVVVGIFSAALAALKAVFIGLKVAAVASWSAVLGPAIGFIAVAGVIVAIVLAMKDAFKMLWDAIKELGAGFADVFAAIKNIAKDTYEAIKIAFSAGDLAGAAQVGLAALKVAWLTGIMPLKKAWYDFEFFLADSWSIISGEVLKIANNLWYGLLIGMKSIGNGIAKTWDSIWGGILNSFESIIAEMQKKWIQLKGMFDSDIDVDAEIRKVDAETNANQFKRARNSYEAANRRNMEVQRLDQERNNRNTQIDERMRSGMSENRSAYEKAMQDAAKGIRDAEKDWKNAVEEVKKKAEVKEIAPETKIVESKMPQIEKIQSSLESKTGKTISGFDAKALSGLFGRKSEKDIAAEKTAKATEDSAKHLKEISDKMNQGWSIG